MLLAEKTTQTYFSKLRVAYNWRITLCLMLSIAFLLFIRDLDALAFTNKNRFSDRFFSGHIAFYAIVFLRAFLCLCLLSLSYYFCWLFIASDQKC